MHGHGARVIVLGNLNAPFTKMHQETTKVYGFTGMIVYNEDAGSISSFSNICLGCETAVTSVHQDDLSCELQKGKAFIS